MKRDIERDLLRWKNQKGRMPLLLRGARQVGKSFVVEKFGKANFDQCIVLNFEQHPEYKQCFTTLEPPKIIAAIELLTGVPIQPGQTLLFFDEIQECPEAITALRYFKEQSPALHVIGAGSLLEFVLNDANFRMPVGRVQYMYLRPLSFGEYLDASGNSQLREYLHTLHVDHSPEKVIHERLVGLVREYMALGGMPAVVAHYLETRSFLQCQEIQSGILLGIRKDFGKYARHTQQSHLETIFNKAPGLIAHWVKYSKFDSDSSLRALKSAFQKLCEAGILIPVYATSAAGLPFVTHMNERKFKLLFLDVGLVKRACQLDLDLLLKENLLLINAGALAEQFVGQELLAYTAKEEANALFFWTREKPSSSAEIDYLIAVDGRIVPIEVKAGAIGTLRSLKIFLTETKARLGVRISQLPLSLDDQVLSVPFYLISELPRLVNEIRRSGFH